MIFKKVLFTIFVILVLPVILIAETFKLDTPGISQALEFSTNLSASTSLATTEFEFLATDTLKTAIYKAFPNMSLLIYCTKDSTNFCGFKVRPYTGYTKPLSSDITRADSTLFHFKALVDTTTVSSAGTYLLTFTSILGDYVYFVFEGATGGSTGYGTTVKESRIKGWR